MTTDLHIHTEFSYDSDANMEMYEKYYLVLFKIFQQEYYTFWYTDDKDGFMIDESGLIRSFPTKELAVAFS